MPPRLTVLWAIDGSVPSVAAAPLLNSLVLPRTATLHVLTVAPAPLLSGARPDPVYFRPWTAAAKRAAMQEAEQVARTAAEQLDPGSFEVHLQARFGHPINEILRAAWSTRADLIVVGAKGHSNLRLMLLGSVAQGVLQYASRPVLLVRPDARSVHLVVAHRRIPNRAASPGVPSVPGAEALDATGSHPGLAAYPAGATPHRRPKRRLLHGSPRHQRKVHSAGTHDLVAAHTHLGEFSGPIADEMPTGASGVDLLRIADERNADLIVVGSRPPSRSRKYLIGSTAERVARESLASVLVVR